MADLWKEIVELLSHRDRLEKADSKYFHAFAQLARLKTTTVDANLDRLVKENCEIREENEILVTRLNLQTVRLETAKASTMEHQRSLRSQESKIAKLQKKISQLTQELAEKNRLFELLNDEHLIAQIQLNVLKERNEGIP